MRANRQEGSRPATSAEARARLIRRTIVIAAVVVVAVGVIAGVAIYNDRVKPFHTTVLQVDATSVSMSYFLKRVAISRDQPISVLQTLAREEMLKEEAPHPPYSITVTPQEIESYARDIARGQDATIGDAEYHEWYRQQLNQTRLTDAEFKELLRTSVLAVKMNSFLADRIPTVADQVFVNMIAVPDIATATEVKQKYDAGQDFGSLARQYSRDPQLKADSGKVGWFPPGVLSGGLDEAAFALKTGQASEPIYVSDQYTVLIMVSARATARQIDDKALEVLRSRALDSWYQGAYARHTVAFKGFTHGFDSKTEAWVQRQMLKMGIQLNPATPPQ